MQSIHFELQNAIILDFSLNMIKEMYYCRLNKSNNYKYTSVYPYSKMRKLPDS